MSQSLDAIFTTYLEYNKAGERYLKDANYHFRIQMMKSKRSMQLEGIPTETIDRIMRLTLWGSPDNPCTSMREAEMRQEVQTAQFAKQMFGLDYHGE
jgi:hypothetical protein